MTCIVLFHGFFVGIIISSQMLTILSETSVALHRSHAFNRNFKPRPRVVGGVTDVNNKYPYVVTLEMETSFKLLPFIRVCSGTLISSQFVITAAHCLRSELHFVRCGNMTLSLNESSCLSKILNQVAHPSFGNYATCILNDVALLHIEELSMRFYGILNVADYTTLTGKAVKYAGFGRTIHASELNKQEVLTNQNSSLQIGEGVIFKDNDKHILLSTHPQLLIAPTCSKRKQFAFSGDSGGPLFVNNKVAGVACAVVVPPHLSSGEVKSHPPYMAYTPTSPYLDWIRQVMTSFENR